MTLVIIFTTICWPSTLLRSVDARISCALPVLQAFYFRGLWPSFSSLIMSYRMSVNYFCFFLFISDFLLVMDIHTTDFCQWTFVADVAPRNLSGLCDLKSLQRVQYIVSDRHGLAGKTRQEVEFISFLPLRTSLSETFTSNCTSTELLFYYTDSLEKISTDDYLSIRRSNIDDQYLRKGTAIILSVH